MNLTQALARIHTDFDIVEVYTYRQGTRTVAEALLADGWTGIFTYCKRDGVCRIKYRRTDGPFRETIEVNA